MLENGRPPSAFFIPIAAPPSILVNAVVGMSVVVWQSKPPGPVNPTEIVTPANRSLLNSGSDSRAYPSPISTSQLICWLKKSRSIAAWSAPECSNCWAARSRRSRAVQTECPSRR